MDAATVAGRDDNPLDHRADCLHRLVAQVWILKQAFQLGYSPAIGFAERDERALAYTNGLHNWPLWVNFVEEVGVAASLRF
jgi:hypothetical protein